MTTPADPQRPDDAGPPGPQPGFGPPPGGRPGPTGPSAPPPGYGPPTGQFAAQPRPEPSLEERIRSLPPKKLARFAAFGGGGLLVLILLLVFITSGGGPSDAVDDYLSTVADGEVADSQQYLCEPGDGYLDPGDEKKQDEVDKNVAGMDWEIVSEHVAGDQAQLEVNITGTDRVAGEREFELEQRDGDWFICHIGSGSSY